MNLFPYRQRKRYIYTEFTNKASHQPGTKITHVCPHPRPLSKSLLLSGMPFLPVFTWLGPPGRPPPVTSDPGRALSVPSYTQGGALAHLTEPSEECPLATHGWVHPVTGQVPHKCLSGGAVNKGPPPLVPHSTSSSPTHQGALSLYLSATFSVFAPTSNGAWHPQ